MNISKRGYIVTLIIFICSNFGTAQNLKAVYRTQLIEYYGNSSPEVYLDGVVETIIIYNDENDVDTIVLVDSTNYNLTLIRKKGIETLYFLPNFTISSENSNYISLHDFRVNKVYSFYRKTSDTRYKKYDKPIDFCKVKGECQYQIIDSKTKVLHDTLLTNEILYRVTRKREPTNDPKIESCVPLILTSINRKILIPNVLIPNGNICYHHYGHNNMLLYWDEIVETEMRGQYMYTKELDNYSYMSMEENNKIEEILKNLLEELE